MFLISLAVVSLIQISRKSDKEKWMARHYRKKEPQGQYAQVKTTERMNTSHNKSYDEESKKPA